jgi:hypothetical protein
MAGNAHEIQCNPTTSCKYVILAMKKKLALANDAYFTLYDVTTDDMWWDQSSRIMLNSTNKMVDVTKNWASSGKNHVLVFRRRIYVPGSPLEAEVSAARHAKGAHQLAYWEAAHHARTMMHRYINVDQVYMLAAMQLQANEGDLTIININLGTNPNALPTILKDAKVRARVTTNIDRYIHVDVRQRTPLGQLVDGVLSKWAEFQGFDKFQAQTVFLGYVQQSPLYGSEMLEVGVRQKKESSEEGRQPFRSDMKEAVNFAISHFGVRLFPKDDGEEANTHGNLTIWEHPFKDIKQWVTSESGDYFAYIVENTRVYVKW